MRDRVIRAYEFSPAKNFSNAEMVARYHENQDINNLPGVRGPILALWLDKRIRSQSEGRYSLDDMMSQVAEESAENPRLALTTRRVLKTAGTYLRDEDRKKLSSYLESGTAVEIPEFPQGRCARLTVDPVGKFELGFDGLVLASGTQFPSITSKEKETRTSRRGADFPGNRKCVS